MSDNLSIVCTKVASEHHVIPIVTEHGHSQMSSIIKTLANSSCRFNYYISTLHVTLSYIIFSAGEIAI